MTGNWAEIEKTVRCNKRWVELEKTLHKAAAQSLAGQRWRLRAQGAVVALVAVLIALAVKQWSLGHG